jgi:hypothetical protein
VSSILRSARWAIVLALVSTLWITALAHCLAQAVAIAEVSGVISDQSGGPVPERKSLSRRLKSDRRAPPFRTVADFTFSPTCRWGRTGWKFLRLASRATCNPASCCR